MKIAFFLAAALALAAIESRPTFAQAQNDAPREITITCKSPAATAEAIRARSLLDNVRVAEANTALDKAIELDPDCASAHALLAAISPASVAQRHVEIALAHAEGLPEPERTQIEITAAFVRGQNAQARELTAKLVELAPDVWRSHNQLGGIALGDRDFAKAVAEFEKAIELNPKAGGAYNNLGYAYANQAKYDHAAAAFRKYAEVAPEEPNAHDSLAEALMNGGRLAEAEAEFRKALEIQPSFAGAWTGIAQTRFLRGNWTGGSDALAKETRIDLRPQAVLGAEVNVALGYLAQGKTAECWKRLDRVVAKASKQDLPQQFGVTALRARLLSREGKPAEAMKLARTALDGAEKSNLPAGTKANLRRTALVEMVRASALAGRAGDAERALAALEEAVKPVAQVAFFASALQNSRGLLALARNDLAGAVEAMRACVPPDFNCHYDLVRAQQQAGDKAGAAATREAYLKTPVRGIEYVYLWKKLGGKPSASMASAPGGK